MRCANLNMGSVVPNCALSFSYLIPASVPGLPLLLCELIHMTKTWNEAGRKQTVRSERGY